MPPESLWLPRGNPALSEGGHEAQLQHNVVMRGRSRYNAPYNNCGRCGGSGGLRVRDEE
jgi:hypothetical protein